MATIKTKYGICYSSDTSFWNYSDFDDCGLYIGDTGRLAVSPSKRLKNVYPLICHPDNIIRSQYTAQLGKKRRSEIVKFNANIIDNLQAIYEMLDGMAYQPGEYRKKTITEPKEREIMIAPFFPDRIIHHCIINVLGRFWSNIFIANTYACVKGRGIHRCMLDVHKALTSDRKGTKYCLKIDIRKFYDNIDHRALKGIVRIGIADERLLWLLDTVIDSNGEDKKLPIGNYTSQYFANLYLAYFDHWVKEQLSPQVMALFGAGFYYFRYMDDMVMLCASKEALHYILDMMGLYLASELKMEIKPNWQIFPVDARGIDFVGFKQNHDEILLRKSILMRFYSKCRKTKEQYFINDETAVKHFFPSEYGWITRCSEKHSRYIINNCLDNENKCTHNRVAG